MIRLLGLALCLSLAPLGCSSSDDDMPPGGLLPYAPPPASAIVDTSPVRIRREVLKISTPAPPKNPQATTNAETPADYNFVRVVRYRIDSAEALPARAVVVLMPGFLGGAMSYDPLARALVRRSPSDAAIEVWAIDRRANFLEDHHGLDVAEVRGDPELARTYYFENVAQEGKTYQGVQPPESLSYMSEWGLETTINDLRAVIDLVPEPERKSRVVLVGHSLGASIVEEFSAWDFAGKPGYEDLAALVLIDGATGSEGKVALPVTQQAYENGDASSPYLMAGLKRIRQDSPYFVLPILGSDVFPVAAIEALRASLRPMEVTSDPARDAVMRVLLGLNQVPNFTNRAALGFAFDRAYNSLTFAAVSCGAGTGGSVAPYHSPLGADLFHPTDLSATYDWIDYDKAHPSGHTSLDELARSWFLGPELDFAEWYFPTRLALDAPAAGSLILADGDWPRKVYGLRAIHGRKMDLPIMGLAAALVGKGMGDTSAFDALRSLIAAVPIGPGRPQEGLPRDRAEAFRVLGYPQLTHIDPIMGADAPPSQAHEFYDSLYNFVMMNTKAGTSTVPLPSP